MRTVADNEGGGVIQTKRLTCFDLTRAEKSMNAFDQEKTKAVQLELLG